MEYTVIYDDLPSFIEGCTRDFGLSVHISLEGLSLLFDAGSRPEVLLKNSRTAGLDLSKIRLVVVSHPHTDHTGGLKALASGGPTVYVPHGQHKGLQEWLNLIGLKEVVVVKGVRELYRGVYVIPFPESQISEQALLVESGGGYTMFVGCSHPGVHYMVGRAVEEGFKVERVVGGLHLSGQPEYKARATVMELKRLGVKELLPLHCSGDLVLQYANLLGMLREKPSLCKTYRA
ncbi:beta-lactamase domain protein [Thermogladius calderae 1633]|uniref:Beta-lactamase domain protein n=1 Tax=Thermogladius calderae (strain DSM 22663 / VKM B-2946 / 1633) TaxID=1184251 RepID=I3TG21_THEC1|nr:MBL fold metallo-hydrolase [Thermogladius calderae]AFK51709.1 beta-lactamase domain protein [Thermogladius calderae 1633]